MRYSRKGLLTTLMFGAAFLAGAGTGPASRLIAGHSGLALGVNAAFAQDAENADNTDAYRLLALFGDVFERVRLLYVDPVSDKDLIANAINGMVSGLDPHSGYMSVEEFREMEEEDKGEFTGLGMEVTQEDGIIKVASTMDGAPASKAGVKVGDIIIALNGRSVQGLSLDDALAKMRGSPNSKITLAIRRVGVDRVLVMPMLRKVIHINVVKQRMEPDNIGYVQLSEFSEQADAALKQAIQSLRRQAGDKLKALILDLRDNPGGLLDQAVAICGEFIDRGEVVSTRDRYAEDDEWLRAKGADILDGAPLIVLINGGSASASEVVAGALQDRHRAVLVGTRSFGKGSVQTVFPLSGLGAIRLTTGRYYTPSGRSIQGLGIVPDVPVSETRDDVQHFDPEREADLNHILTNEGGVPDTETVLRSDLPSIAKGIPRRPPDGFPEFEPAKPDATDFQLQQALVIAKAMATERNHGAHN